MPAVVLAYLGGAGWQFLDDSGDPLAGGLVYAYIAGTTTPKTTYTDNTGNTQNAYPIELDAAGRPPSEVWVESTSSTKFVITDSEDVVIRTYDNTPSVNSNGVIVGNLSVSGNTALAGGLVVDGETVLNSDLTAGDTELSSLVVTGSLTVNGATVLTDGLTVDEIDAVTGTFDNVIVSGDVAIGDDLTITGQVTGSLTIETDLSIGNDLSIGADISIGGVISAPAQPFLSVSGGTLSSDGIISYSTTLHNVGGFTTTTGKLIPPSAGVYIVSTSGRFSLSDEGETQYIYIQHYSATNVLIQSLNIYREQAESLIGADSLAFGGSGIFKTTAGDYFAIYYDEQGTATVTDVATQVMRLA